EGGAWIAQGRSGLWRKMWLLAVEERVEPVEAVRVAGGAVDGVDAGADVRPHRLAAIHQRGQPSLDDFLLASARRDGGRLAAAARGQMLGPRGGAQGLVDVPPERGVPVRPAHPSRAR